jgi:hypothetical protein
LLEYSLPLGYRRRKPILEPMLAPRRGVLDDIPEENEQRTKKQWHTGRSSND